QAKRDCVAIKPNLTVPVRFQIDSNCRSIPVLDQFEPCNPGGRSIFHGHIDPGNAALVVEAQGLGVAEIAVAFEVEEELVAFRIAIEDPAVVGRVVYEIKSEAVVGTEARRKLADDLDGTGTLIGSGEFLVLGGSQWTHRADARRLCGVAGWEHLRGQRQAKE